MKFFGLLLAAGLAACAGPQLKTTRGVAVELTATPFFAQEDHQCGPAALATVLVADGVSVTPDELTPLVFLPQRKGSLQIELIAATRHYSRVPYLLKGGLPALLQEIEAGKPVMVLQNLGAGFWPFWHYAVVIGYEPSRNQLILRSGRDQRLTMSTPRFMRSWRLADHWAIVATQPDSLPVTAEPRSWLTAASDFEPLGQTALASRAYAAAVQRWPDDPLVWFASANAAYAAQDLPSATIALRRSLTLAPDDAVVRNNLAQVLFEQGCHAEAATQIALALEDASELQRADILKTQTEIQNAPVNSAGTKLQCSH